MQTSMQDQVVMWHSNTVQVSPRKAIAWLVLFITAHTELWEQHCMLLNRFGIVCGRIWLQAACFYLTHNLWITWQFTSVNLDKALCSVPKSSDGLETYLEMFLLITDRCVCLCVCLWSWTIYGIFMVRELKISRFHSISFIVIQNNEHLLL